MADSTAKDDHGRSTPLWRLAFDAVERPIATACEAWVRSDAFMDGFALAWRWQRHVADQAHRGVDAWLGVLRVATRGDVDRLSNEVAAVERQLRDVRRELERADGSPGSELPLRERGVTARRRPARRAAR